MHPSTPQLQTYLDGETPEPARERLTAHLEACPECRTTLQHLEAHAARVGTRFAHLNPTLSDTVPASRAYAHLQQKLQKENNMFKKLFSPKMRPALATTLIIAFFAIVLTVPSIRAAAVDFLGLFRVQQIQVVEFNPANLPQNMEGNFRNIDQIIANNLTVEEAGDPIPAADAAEASKLAGFDVLLPQAFQGDTQLTVQPATTASFTIDLALWQSILNEMGRTDIQLPKEIDGQTITLYADRSVTFVAGNCDVSADSPEGFAAAQRDCTVLAQTPSPRVDAPSTLPIDELGQAALRFLGMSASDAASFSQKIDWTTTLILPVPSGSDYRDVTVQGVPGTLFLDSGRSNGYHLMWVKDGIVYALSGQGTMTDALALANSLK
ncbi:MAG: zf-HC2 domain-containing protein [Anaerolineales bacterium]|nr:zf-HC2 domain-containing protein [Anaerolineales bacterium]